MTTLGLVNPNSKYLKAIRKEPLECSVHGLHSQWRVLLKTKSVKCKLCASEDQKQSRSKYPIKHLLKDAKYHAKQRNRKFDICEQDIINQLAKQNNKCAISGLSFSEYKISLDRIDSTKDYTPDNIQLVTIQVNRMKSDFVQEDFINTCKAIALFNQEK